MRNFACANFFFCTSQTSVLKCLKLVFFKYWAFLCLPQNVVFAARFRSNRSFSMKLSHQKLFCMIYNWRDRATKTTVTENDKIIIIKKWKANVESCSTLFGRCLCHHRTTNDTVTLWNMVGKAMSIAIVLTSIFLPTFPHNFSYFIRLLLLLKLPSKLFTWRQYTYRTIIKIYN